MKYFINNETKDIFAYKADGSQDEFIKPGLLPYNRVLDGGGNFYHAYLDTPDVEGVYQPDLPVCLSIDKEIFKSIMKSEKETFCCSGALLTINVSEVEYTGIFCPDDRGLESASGVASYRAGVDVTKPPVPMGDFWYAKDESGNDVAIPITEELITDIQIAVKNWYTECGRVYKERKIAMLAMPDVTGFDPVADMQAHLPSRDITVT